MQQVTQKKMAKYAALGNKIEQLRKEFCQMKDEIISDLDAGAAERDERFKARAEPSEPAERNARTIKGHITRDLVAELRKALEEERNANT